MRRLESTTRRHAKRAAFLVAVLFVASACGGAERPAGYRDEPPVPANLDQIDPDVARRVEVAVEAVRSSSADYETWGELGMLYEVVGLRTQAIECYAQAALRDPLEPRWWYRRAVCRGRLDEVEGAIEDMDRALALDPNYAPAHYRRGMFQLENGALSAARQSFAEATRVGPEFTGGWVGTARVLLQEDQNEAAAEILERFNRAQPDDAVVAQLLTVAYRQAGLERSLAQPTGGTATAEFDADEGAGGAGWDDPWQAELRPYRKKPESHRYFKMLEAGKLEPLIKKLEARRISEPSELTFLPQLAESYYQVGRVDEARETCQALLAAEPENIPARMALARFNILSGEPEPALVRLDQVNRIDPSYGPAWVTKGRLLLDEAQYEAAAKALARALEHDQRDAVVWLWKAQAESSALDWESALESARTYLERVPDDGAARVLFAKALMRTGELEAASAELERARASAGTDVRGGRQLEKALREAQRRAAKRAERSRDS